MPPKKKQQKKADVVKQPEKSFPRKNYFILLGLAAITYICFSLTLKNDFTNWDDEVYVKNNPLVTNKNISCSEIFRTPVSLNYHPLTILSLAWNYNHAKLDAHAYLLTNIWLHVLNTLLVFLFIFWLTQGRWIAATVTTLWFGIHPMHVESVSWVAERKDVLYTFFFLASCICYVKFSERKKWWWYLLSFILFVASVLSKAMGVVLPLVLIAIDYFRGWLWSVRTPTTGRNITSTGSVTVSTSTGSVTVPRRLSLSKPNWKIIAEKIPFLIVALIFGVVAFRVQSKGAIAEMQVFEIYQRIMFACYGFVMYIVKLIAPLNLSAFYPYPTYDKHAALPIIFYVLPFVIIAAAALIYFRFRKQRFLIFGLLFYFFTVVLVLQFISVGSAIMADRYTYLSSIGLFFIAGFVADKILSEKSVNENFSFPKIITAIALAGFSLFFFIQTQKRIPVWKNSETLWTDVINKFPERVEVAYKNRGNYYGQHNRVDEAYNDYMILTTKMHSKDSRVYSNLGNVYGLQKKFPEAMSTYTKAIAMDSTNYEAYVNRGITYSMLGQPGNALSDFSAAIRLQPNSSDAYANRAMIYFNSGEFEKAIDDFTRRLQMNEEDATAYYYRGLAHYKLNQIAEAKQDLLQAQQLNFRGDFSLLKKL